VTTDQPPDVRVGIVSWNTSALLDRCLAALPAALDGLVAEIVVVDNASDDDSAAVAARHPDVHVISNTDNLGYARAMNQALRATGAPVLLALNPDTEPPPGSLSRLVATLHEHPEAAVVLPRLAHADGSLQHSVYRYPSLAVAAVVCFVPPRWQRSWVGRRWWLEGAAPHERSGKVDWGWFMYVEDLELCWRLGQQGWSVWFDANVTVPHVGNAAGAQAWGAARETRWLEATYDFYGQARGLAAARRWAALNSVGVLVHLVVLTAGSLAPEPARGRRRSYRHQLRSSLKVHLRALAKGPPPPSSVPASAPAAQRRDR